MLDFCDSYEAQCACPFFETQCSYVIYVYELLTDKQHIDIISLYEIATSASSCKITNKMII